MILTINYNQIKLRNQLSHHCVIFDKFPKLVENSNFSLSLLLHTQVFDPLNIAEQKTFGLASPMGSIGLKNEKNSIFRFLTFNESWGKGVLHIGIFLTCNSWRSQLSFERENRLFGPKFPTSNCLNFGICHSLTGLTYMGVRSSSSTFRIYESHTLIIS